MSKIFILMWMIFALLVGYFWYTRQKSFLLGFVASFLISPVIALIIAFFLPYDKNKHIEERKIPYFQMILAFGFFVLAYFYLGNIGNVDFANIFYKDKQPTGNAEIGSASSRKISIDTLKLVIEKECKKYGFTANVMIEENAEKPGVYGIGISLLVKTHDSDAFIEACVKGVAIGLRRAPLNVEIIMLDDHSHSYAHMWYIKPEICLRAYSEGGYYNSSIVEKNIQEFTEHDLK